MLLLVSFYHEGIQDAKVEGTSPGGSEEAPSTMSAGGMRIGGLVHCSFLIAQVGRHTV